MTTVVATSAKASGASASASSNPRSPSLVAKKPETATATTPRGATHAIRAFSLFSSDDPIRLSQIATGLATSIITATNAAARQSSLATTDASRVAARMTNTPDTSKTATCSLNRSNSLKLGSEEFPNTIPMIVTVSSPLSSRYWFGAAKAAMTETKSTGTFMYSGIIPRRNRMASARPTK